MGKHISVGSAPALPLALLAQAIPSLTRGDLEALTERLIDRLDMMDGDPELEEDDPSGQCDEDEVSTGHGGYYQHGQSFDGPGCPISDPDSGIESQPHDQYE